MTYKQIEFLKNLIKMNERMGNDIQVCQGWASVPMPYGRIRSRQVRDLIKKGFLYQKWPNPWRIGMVGLTNKGIDIFKKGE